MRPENARMKEYLDKNGVKAIPKWLPDGSLKRTWRLYDKNTQWSIDLAAKLNSLGFLDYNGKPLDEHSGNGGMFQVFVRGHNDMVTA